MRTVQLMNSRAGRVARSLVGLTLIGTGLAIGGTGGLVVAVIGLIPLAAGTAGACLIAPLLRVPLRAR